MDLPVTNPDSDRRPTRVYISNDRLRVVLEWVPSGEPLDSLLPRLPELWSVAKLPQPVPALPDAVNAARAALLDPVENVRLRVEETHKGPFHVSIHDGAVVIRPVLIAAHYHDASPDTRAS